MFALIDANLKSKPPKKNSLVQFSTAGVNIESYQENCLYNSSKNIELIIFNTFPQGLLRRYIINEQYSLPLPTIVHKYHRELVGKRHHLFNVCFNLLNEYRDSILYYFD